MVWILKKWCDCGSDIGKLLGLGFGIFGIFVGGSVRSFVRLFFTFAHWSALSLSESQAALFGFLRVGGYSTPLSPCLPCRLNVSPPLESNPWVQHIESYRMSDRLNSLGFSKLLIKDSFYYSWDSCRSARFRHLHEKARKLWCVSFVAR